MLSLFLMVMLRPLMVILVCPSIELFALFKIQFFLCGALLKTALNTSSHLTSPMASANNLSAATWKLVTKQLHPLQFTRCIYFLDHLAPISQGYIWMTICWSNVIAHTKQLCKANTIEAVRFHLFDYRYWNNNWNDGMYCYLKSSVHLDPSTTLAWLYSVTREQENKENKVVRQDEGI